MTFSQFLINSNKKYSSKHARICRIEELEGREMLSVSPWALADDLPCAPTSLLGNVVESAPVYECDQSVFDSVPLQPLGAVDNAMINAINTKYGLALALNTNVVKVTSANNSGAGSLRDVIGSASAGSIIVINSSIKNITLTTGELAISKNLTIVSEANNLTISGNNQSRVFSIAEDAKVTLAGITVTKGKAEKGGGIFNKGILSVTHCTILGNAATGLSEITNGGGGIYNDNGGTVSLSYSTISENSARFGGGLFNNNSDTYITTITLTHCTVSKNTAASRGGGIFSTGIDGTVTATNCAITKNSAQTSGGGIDFVFGIMTVSNCTIADNEAASGGGIFSSLATITINNTIIAQNSAIDIVNSSGTVSGNNNLVGNVSGTIAFVNTLTGDPLFFNVAKDNYRLSENSPAIDKGGNGFVPAWLTCDLAGNPRIIDGTVDIGAYEYKDMSCSATAGTNSLIVSYGDFLPTEVVLLYSQAGTEDWFEWKAVSTGTNVTLSGLRAGRYDVRLVDTQGDDVYSKTGIWVDSSGIPPAPMKHKASVDKKESKPTISTVTLVITQPKDNVNKGIFVKESNVRYVIDIIQVGKVKDRPSDFTPISVTADWLVKNNNKLLIEGLNPNTSYKFTVTAVNAVGMEAKNAGGKITSVVTVSAKTATFTAVQKLKLDKIALPPKGVSTNSVALTWMPSKTPVPVTRYEILWYVDKSKEPTPLPGTITVTISGTSAKITGKGLLPGTSYKFAVRAITTVDGKDISSLDAKISAKTL